jgi:hypothetical protein
VESHILMYIAVDRQLPYGPPTEADIKKIRESWYSQLHTDLWLTKDCTYCTVRWDQATKYGCVTQRLCDMTYWYIRDVFRVYNKWMGPALPYEVVPVKKEYVDYVRKSI